MSFGTVRAWMHTFLDRCVRGAFVQLCGGAFSCPSLRNIGQCYRASCGAEEIVHREDGRDQGAVGKSLPCLPGWLLCTGPAARLFP